MFYVRVFFCVCKFGVMHTPTDAHTQALTSQVHLLILLLGRNLIPGLTYFESAFLQVGHQLEVERLTVTQEFSL